MLLLLTAVTLADQLDSESAGMWKHCVTHGCIGWREVGLPRLLSLLPEVLLYQMVEGAVVLAHKGV
jgi:hypothetical protein